MQLVHDTHWSEQLPRPLQLGLATFGILALELALIRWTSGQLRIFAYFNNLILIGAFLGMGLGVALGRRWAGLVHLTLPLLLLISLPLALAEDLGLVHLAFPAQEIFLWGAERTVGGVVEIIRNLGIFALLYLGIVGLFVAAGGPVGYLFARLPPLQAYSFDLLGSLAGVILFTALTFLDTSPPCWLALGGLPLLLLSRKWFNLVALILILGLGWASVRGAVYSPYNRIDIEGQPPSITLRVNRDFHQYMHDFSVIAPADPGGAAGGMLTPEQRQRRLRDRRVYDLPFQVNPVRDRALVVGAGTGNDVQAALRNGYQEVTSVDIDGRIIELGTRLHPERPYADPRVAAVVNDARAYFEQYRGQPFDVVCYGLLDSHAMFSSMSTLRLDNYVYTVEGLRRAWRHVAERGHLTLSFSILAGPWIFDRLYWTLTEATGHRPRAVYHDMHFGATFIVARHPEALDLGPLQGFDRLEPSIEREEASVTTDDWPFLYLRPDTFPWVYLLVLLAILLLAAAALPLAFGRRRFTTGFDPPLFFMGAAFMLIETRGVTSLSLLFGSTWIVNSAIFAGVLLLVLLANLVVLRRSFTRVWPWFAGLFASILLVWLFRLELLHAFPLVVRGGLGGLLIASPIFFAGILVSLLLARSADPAAALGSNLLGSVLGGALEYLSMFTGLSALALLAAALYLAALLFLVRRSAAEASHSATIS